MAAYPRSGRARPSFLTKGLTGRTLYRIRKAFRPIPENQYRDFTAPIFLSRFALCRLPELRKPLYYLCQPLNQFFRNIWPVRYRRDCQPAANTDRPLPAGEASLSHIARPRTGVARMKKPPHREAVPIQGHDGLWFYFALLQLPDRHPKPLCYLRQPPNRSPPAHWHYVIPICTASAARASIVTTSSPSAFANPTV